MNSSSEVKVLSHQAHQHSIGYDVYRVWNTVLSSEVKVLSHRDSLSTLNWLWCLQGLEHGIVF